MTNNFYQWKNNCVCFTNDTGADIEVTCRDGTVWVAIDTNRSNWDDPGQATIRIPIAYAKELFERIAKFEIDETENKD